MAKRKPEFELYSYGIYSQWERESKEIPKLMEITTIIPAQIDIEFGYVLKIKRGKGIKLHFTIEHPPFEDENGKLMPPFTGEHFVNSNDWQFFLGDTIWEPMHNKLGEWRLITEYNGQVVASKTLNIIEP
mgnify:CR=1 FL=1